MGVGVGDDRLEGVVVGVCVNVDEGNGLAISFTTGVGAGALATFGTGATQATKTGSEASTSSITLPSLSATLSSLPKLNRATSLMNVSLVKRTALRDRIDAHKPGDLVRQRASGRLQHHAHRVASLEIGMDHQATPDKRLAGGLDLLG